MNLNSNNKYAWPIGMCANQTFITPVAKLRKFPQGFVYKEATKLPDRLKDNEETAKEIQNRTPNKSTKSAETDLPPDGSQKRSDVENASKSGQEGFGNVAENDIIFGTQQFDFRDSDSDSSDSECIDFEPPAKKRNIERNDIFKLI